MALNLVPNNVEVIARQSPKSQYGPMIQEAIAKFAQAASPWMYLFPNDEDQVGSAKEQAEYRLRVKNQIRTLARIRFDRQVAFGLTADSTTGQHRVVWALRQGASSDTTTNKESSTNAASDGEGSSTKTLAQKMSR